MRKRKNGATKSKRVMLRKADVWRFIATGYMQKIVGIKTWDATLEYLRVTFDDEVCRGYNIELEKDFTIAIRCVNKYLIGETNYEPQ